ncbi:MAG: thioredoxin [Erysipelotrichaceae bacterium]|nr:thioredoxin [Erysipelotrichaceae bacterium]
MKIIDALEFEETIKEGLTLVDFFAEWCGPCKMLGPVLEKLDEEYPDVTFVKVNVDNNMELAERFGIMSIPAVFLFKNGEVLDKMIGFRDEYGVKQFIEDAIA